MSAISPRILYKEKGKTPLEALEAFRCVHPEYHGISMTYAGRLDPLAHGLLLILAGDEVHDKEKYLAYDKEYEAYILVGAHTDTYDVLGMVDRSDIHAPHHTHAWWSKIVSQYEGIWEQPYPPYASKTVDGIPLFVYARSGRLDTITIPTKKVTITSCALLDISESTVAALLESIDTSLSLVKGDFRQEEIRKRWREIYSEHEHMCMQLVRIRVSCSSGTYIRSIVHRISMDTGIPLCLWDLKRTRIGVFTENDITII